MANYTQGKDYLPVGGTEVRLNAAPSGQAGTGGTLSWYVSWDLESGFTGKGWSVTGYNEEYGVSYAWGYNGTKTNDDIAFALQNLGGGIQVALHYDNVANSDPCGYIL